MKKILSICLIITLSFVLCACGQSGPQKAVVDYFEAMKVHDRNKIKQVVVDGVDFFEEMEKTENEQTKILVEIFKRNASKLTYTIKEIKRTDDEGTVVTVNCSYVDMYDLIIESENETYELINSQEYKNQIVNEADIFLEKIKKKSKENKTIFKETTININCISSDEKWFVFINRDLFNIFTCNSLSAFSKLE